MPKSFRKGPWSGKVDLTRCRSMGIIHEMGDGIVHFQTTHEHVCNPEEALVLHANPNRHPPQFQGQPGSSSSQGGGFLTFKVCVIFCRRTYYAPATLTAWPATPTPRSEQWSATSPKCKMT
ncbi:hypothetical protein Hanom_Chr04g00333631 [Helianthus anomalus]